jgi:hypothetical protein
VRQRRAEAAALGTSAAASGGAPAPRVVVPSTQPAVAPAPIMPPPGPRTTTAMAQPVPARPATLLSASLRTAAPAPAHTNGGPPRLADDGDDDDDVGSDYVHSASSGQDQSDGDVDHDDDDDVEENEAARGPPRPEFVPTVNAQGKTVYACPSCATVFLTQSLLALHFTKHERVGPAPRSISRDEHLPLRPPKMVPQGKRIAKVRVVRRHTHTHTYALYRTCACVGVDYRAYIGVLMFAPACQCAPSFLNAYIYTHTHAHMDAWSGAAYCVGAWHAGPQQRCKSSAHPPHGPLQRRP